MSKREIGDAVTEFAAAHAAGRELGEANRAILWVGANDDTTPFMVLQDPDGGQKVENLERFLKPPSDWYARRGAGQFADVASFCAYVQRFRTPEVLLTADPHGHCLAAQLDYHQAGEKGIAGLVLHTAKLTLRGDPAWKAWNDIDGRSIGQVGFAEFLEDHLREIAEPDGAAVLEAASNLQAKKNVEFESGINLTNGAVQLRFLETVESKGKGMLTVPDHFVLSLPVYEFGDPVRLDVRLRWRIQEQKLSFVVKLDRPDLAQKEAFAAVMAAVEGQLGFKPLLGTVSVPAR